MRGQHPPRPILILGPTAGGKSPFAVELALRIGGEIIGADSMQVYRHMNAGTAKPSPALRQRVPHHLIDIIEPTDSFTVADWLTRAEAMIGSLQQRSLHPVIVGGTNFYMKALLLGMFEGPPADVNFRQSLNGVPPGELHRRLAQIDSAAAERIDRHDHKRLVRALEVFELTGKPISQWQAQWEPGLGDSGLGGKADNPSSPPGVGNACGYYRHNPILVGLDWPREIINRRINERVKYMFTPEAIPPELLAEGEIGGESLPAETLRLEAAGQLGMQARQALGYKQVLDHLAGRMTLDEAFERTKILTRRFAKTQRGWLKRFRGIFWLEAPQKSAAELADAAANVVNANT